MKQILNNILSYSRKILQLILSTKLLLVHFILSLLLLFGIYYFWGTYHGNKELINIELIQQTNILKNLQSELESLRKARPLINIMKQPKYPDEFIMYKISNALKLFNISIVNTQQVTQNNFLIVKKTMQCNVSNLSGLNIVLNELFGKIGSEIVCNIESVKVNHDNKHSFHIIMVLNFVFSNMVFLDSAKQSS